MARTGHIIEFAFRFVFSEKSRREKQAQWAAEGKNVKRKTAYYIFICVLVVGFLGILATLMAQSYFTPALITTPQDTVILK